ncbi:FLU1-II [Irpex rosettiformis]|uniref:FLU1-II n=1 Tax=Irpex rosettiformis TaxID=378272 RepID=A0ACB8U5C2_9APHY|nr:FLU1-II [Irpex rosettiformis]
MSGADECTYEALNAQDPQAIEPSTNANHIARALLENRLDVLDQLGIGHIRILWVDLTNTVRCYMLSRQHMIELLKTPLPGIPTSYASLGMVGIRVAPGLSDRGELLYLIDPSTFRLCTYARGHAVVMGIFREKTPTPQYGLEVPICPRTLLKRVELDAAVNVGVRFLVGFKVFILLQGPKSGIIVGVNDAEYTTESDKLPAGATETLIMKGVVDALVAAGIEVPMMHPEAAPGRFKLITRPLPPVQAADALVFITETIRSIAFKRGYLATHLATFTPSLYEEHPGSGLHAHISVHEINDPTANPKSPRDDQILAPTLSDTVRSFLQGMLTHLPALCALTLPTSASYARVVDKAVSGGTYVVWGSDNRETPIRLYGTPRTESAGGHHFEVKCLDSTACSYVALAGLLGMGADGIKRGVRLTQKDCNTKGVHEMSTEEKVEFGVTDAEVKRLPQSIEEARGTLTMDSDLVSLLGEQFVRDYLSVNELLQNSKEGLTGINEKKDAMMKLIQKY